jgi:hypothetical protein
MNRHYTGHPICGGTPTIKVTFIAALVTFCIDQNADGV